MLSHASSQELNQPPDTQVIRFDRYQVDVHSGELRKDGRKIRLQPQPFRLLLLLLRNAGRIVSREDVRRNLWTGDTFVDFDKGLAAALNKIREALCDPADKPKFVETLPRRGYRFVGKVAFPEQQASAAGGAASGDMGRKSIAVVPFLFRDPSPEDQFLSVALADAVANRLGSSSSLVVRPTNSVLKYSKGETEWSQIARELNVDMVAEGSIQKIGSRIRVLVQVWALDEGRSTHSAKIDGDMGDLFSLQDSLADSVFVALTPRPRNKSSDTVAPPARHPLAFELYLRAVDKALSYNKIELTAAVEMLERTIELDPEFADAWGVLSMACVNIAMHIDPDPKWFARAEFAVNKALEFDPINCNALCSRAWVSWSPSRGFQVRPALRAVMSAVKINPNHYYSRLFRGAILFHHGFHELADEDHKEATNINPDPALPYCSLAYTALYMGDYDLADHYHAMAIAREPALIHANILAPLIPIYKNDLGRARRCLLRAKQMLHGEPQMVALEGLIVAKEGNFRCAEDLADRSVSSERSLIHLHHSIHSAASVYALCGKPDKAMRELRRAAALGLPNHRAFEGDPTLESLRVNPDFVVLMRDLRRDHELLRDGLDLSNPPAPSHFVAR